MPRRRGGTSNGIVKKQEGMGPFTRNTTKGAMNTTKGAMHQDRRNSAFFADFVRSLETHHNGLGRSKNRGLGKLLPVTSVNRGSAGKTRGAISAHPDAAISPALVMTT